MASTLGKANPFRYRGYFYDEETGLYYLKSRYYDPKVGRFICADGYASTGQGLLGANAFAYCGNKPTDRKDPNGAFYDSAWEYHKMRQEYAQAGIAYTHPYPNRSYVVPGHSSYNSARDAINAFYAEYYRKSQYCKCEIGAEIFSITSQGKTTYGYSEPRIGDPHGVTVYPYSPVGTKYIAYAHIHPNSNKFSKEDKELAFGFDVPFYVAGPDMRLQVLSPSGRSAALYYLKNLREVSDLERTTLLLITKMKWDMHLYDEDGFPCKFGCADEFWTS